jgi:hypothetical protein
LEQHAALIVERVASVGAASERRLPPEYPQSATLQISRAPGMANPWLADIRRALFADDMRRALDIAATVSASELTATEELQLIADAIEQPRLPLDLRLRAAEIVAPVGDPRPSVCTLDPHWCDQIAPGDYPIDRAAVRLGAFRIARYPDDGLAISPVLGGRRLPPSALVDTAGLGVA